MQEPSDRRIYNIFLFHASRLFALFPRRSNNLIILNARDAFLADFANYEPILSLRQYYNANTDILSIKHYSRVRAFLIQKNVNKELVHY
jgi:hypothetical protein